MILRTFCVTDQHVKTKVRRNDKLDRKTPTKNQKLLDVGTSSMNRLT